MNKDRILKIKIISTLLGATGGFLYWKFVGCTTGTCPIKSVWYLSTLWGAAMGYLLADLLGSFFLKREKKND